MAEKEYLGIDAKLFARDVLITDMNDLVLVSYKDNVKQAILNRLKTQRGWYELLHSDYGFPIRNLLGKPLTNKNKNKLRTLIYETLLQEPRIKEINNIKVTSDTVNIFINLEVELIEDNGYLNIVVPLNNIQGV